MTELRLWLLLVLLQVGGCGLKGDLYLPEEPAPAEAESAVEPRADDAGEDENRG